MGAHRLAILSGSGVLPRLLLAANPSAFVVTFKGVTADVSGHAASFEKMGALFDTLRNEGVTQVVFAGSMARPALNPMRFDSKMLRLAPRLMAAMKQGDDGLLSTVIEIFEAEGFAVIGAHQAAPALTVRAGLIAGSRPKKPALADAARALDILTTLAPLDIGQGCVVSGGLCLGIETLQGTDALLRFVGETPTHLRRGGGGVLFKAPKSDQELRVDMPAIGVETVRAANAAGLDGIVIAAQKVLLLDRPAIETAVNTAGMFLLAQEVA